MRALHGVPRGGRERFQAYQVPAIVLAKETPKEAVCQIFEKVNTGGVSLTVFELLTATYAVSNFRLRDDWKERDKQIKADPALRSIESTDFIQAITLLATRARRAAAKAAGEDADKLPAISARRKDMLRLKLADYQRYADQTQEAFIAAARLLHSQKVFTARDMPYKTQLVPLAAILVALGSKAENEGVRHKLFRWYWCGVLGELYGSDYRTRFARDLAEVVGGSPAAPNRPLCTRPSSAATGATACAPATARPTRGCYALLMRDGGPRPAHPRDHRAGQLL